MVFTCIDIGGTNTLVGVGNDEFAVVEKVRSERFLDDMQASLADILVQSGHDLSDVEQAAIAVAGPIDRENGVFYPPNIDRDHVHIKEPFEDMGVEIDILNDCNAAALGEYVYGDTTADNMVYLTISTGIGAGIIVDGNLVAGKEGNFGEIGHIILDNNGVKCGCGGTDHWEAYCSGKNLPRMAEAVHGYTFDGARELLNAYYKGDERAEEVVETMQQYNARGIANIINMFDPEFIAIGGGVALNHSDIFVNGLESKISDESVNRVPTIELCSLREQAVIHGLRARCNSQSR